MPERKKAKDRTARMLTFRVYPEQSRLIDEAIRLHERGHLGISHFARESLLDWAHLTVAKARRKERAA